MKGKMNKEILKKKLKIKIKKKQQKISLKILEIFLNNIMKEPLIPINLTD